MGEPQLKINPEEIDDEEDEYDDGEGDESTPQSTADPEPVEKDAPVQMIDKDRVQSMIQALGKQNTIVNDQGKEMDFAGETKEDFIKACEEGYPVIQRTLNSIYEIGQLLSEVRSKLKKKKLYHTWLKFIGLPERTAQNYVQAYDRFTDRLPDFSCLGIKKLLIASKLANCVQYVGANLDRLTNQGAKDLDNEVKALLGKPVTKSGKIKAQNQMKIGSYKITTFEDGGIIIIECTDESDQEKLIQDLTNLYSSSNKLATVASRVDEPNKNKDKIANLGGSIEHQLARTTEQSLESDCDGSKEVAEEEEYDEEEYED